MDASTLGTEATRYLEAIDLFRSLELDVKWRSEADEVGAPPSPPLELKRPPSCERCSGPLVWMNGRRVCFLTLTTGRGSKQCQR
jgi:hypothetical protein